MSSDLERFRDYCRVKADSPASDAERALWTQLADEVDAYLAPADDVQEALL